MDGRRDLLTGVEHPHHRRRHRPPLSLSSLARAPRPLAPSNATFLFFRHCIPASHRSDCAHALARLYARASASALALVSLPLSFSPPSLPSPCGILPPFLFLLPPIPRTPPPPHVYLFSPPAAFLSLRSRACARAILPAAASTSSLPQLLLLLLFLLLLRRRLPCSASGLVRGTRVGVNGPAATGRGSERAGRQAGWCRGSGRRTCTGQRRDGPGS